MKTKILAVVLAAASGTHAAEPGTAVRLTPGAAAPSTALVAELEALDRRLFDAVFGCDIPALRALVADDFEFLHDKWGRTAGSGAAFVEQIAQGCAKQATGENFRARREAVPGSMSVHVLADYGAMQMGEHRFFALQAGQPDRLTESGRFIDVWTREGGGWKLARVISYDHRLAPEPTSADRAGAPQ